MKSRTQKVRKIPGSGVWGAGVSKDFSKEANLIENITQVLTSQQSLLKGFLPGKSFDNFLVYGQIP